MASETSLAVSELEVHVPNQSAGLLRHSKRNYLFDYNAEATARQAVGLQMPVRAEQYQETELFPLFQMNMPEGFVKEMLRARFAKSTRFDAMMMLGLVGGDASIGRVSFRTPEINAQPVTPVSLTSLLADEGAQDMFRELTDAYLLRSGISGVQPKLLVPEAPSAPDQTTLQHGTLITSDLIVKVAGELYPALPVNEFVCMSMARAAGISVPDFFLSEDHKRFIMRRFDRLPDGSRLGFEDMAVLKNAQPEQKYEGSCEQMAKLVSAYCDQTFIRPSLQQLFDQLVLSCLVGNGDAHLKNFGVLYTDPTHSDARLSPAFDIVSTRCYLPNDSFALSLGGSKSFFQIRVDLPEFGSSFCEMDSPEDRIRQIIQAVETVASEQKALIREVPGMEAEIKDNLASFLKRYA